MSQRRRIPLFFVVFFAACRAPQPTRAAAPAAEASATASTTASTTPTPAAPPDPDAPPVPPPIAPPSPEIQEWISVVRLKDHEAGKAPKSITTELEAIDFALARPEVKSKVTPLEAWWGKAQKRDAAHPGRWLVSFGQGDNACNTEYQCTLQVESDGSVARPFECTHGWNCK